MTYLPFYIAFGLLPSFIWLLFYLRRDHHPEPNRMVIKVFILGMISAIIAAVIEVAISEFLDKAYWDNLKIYLADARETTYPFLVFLLYNFIGVAFVEEFVKFYVVKKAVLKSKEFDEPVDAQLYMIISALGFAALENILILLPTGNNIFPQIISQTLLTTGIRFIGATFLHTLSSGTLGFFLALSICRGKMKFLTLSIGFFIASFLHGLYNFSIIKMFDTQTVEFIFIPVFILVFLCVFTLWGFKRLNTIKSTCQVIKK